MSGVAARGPQLVNFPYFSDQIAFAISPNTGYTPASLLAAWVDVSSRVWSSSGVLQGRQYELGQQQPGQGTWTMDNGDEALNPVNASSPYWPNIKPNRIARTTAAWPQAGNLLNDTNALWPDAPVNASDGNFENGLVNHWIPGGAAIVPTLSVDGTHVRSGTKALHLTFSGVPGAFAGAYLLIPVVPGTPMTVSIPVYMTGLLTQATTVVSGLGFGGSTTTLGSFQKLTQTFTPTTPSILVSIIFSGTGAGSAWIDEVQLEFGASSSTYTTAGPKMYVDWCGYIQRWPQSWDKNGFRGIIGAPIIDALALLPKIPLADVATADMLSDNPRCLYQCRESSGTQIGDITGLNGVGTVQPGQANKYGTGGYVTVGDQTSVVSESFPSVKIVSPNQIGTTPYVGLPASAIPGSGPWTIEFATWWDPANVDGFATIYDQTQVSATGLSFTGVTVVASVGAATATSPPIVFFGAFAGQWRNTGDPARPSVTLAAGPAVGAGLHVLTLTLAADNKTVNLYVDGALYDSAVASAAMDVSTAPPTLGSKVQNVGGSNENVGMHAVYGSVLSGARIASHATAILSAYAGEMSGARYARVLGYSTTALPSAIDPGITPMGPNVGMASQTMAQQLAEIVDAEGGNHYVSRGGILTFEGRTARYLEHTPTWLFGENPGAGEIPYTGDIEFDFDPTYIINDITVQRPGGTPQTASSPSSIQDNFDSQTPTQTPNLASDNEARDVATFTIQQFAAGRERVSAITFDPSANPAAWPCALGIKQGDLVQVNRRTSAGLTISLNFYVEQISRTRSDGSYLMTLLLAPVWSTSVWQLGDATYGVLGSTTTLAR